MFSGPIKNLEFDGVFSFFDLSSNENPNCKKVCKMNVSEIPAVILCGGEGLRFRSTDHTVPKVLASIGDLPIVQHIIDLYAHFGIETFYLCIRDDATEIREYFRSHPIPEGRNLFLIETGNDTPTGGRIKALENLIVQRTFFVTYGDGLANVTLPDLVNTHLRLKATVTLTAARPRSPFGQLEIDTGGIVCSFNEKPFLDNWVNAGFFMMDQTVFGHLTASSDLERETLPQLMANRQLAAYEHWGFWQSMDTAKEHSLLNSLALQVPPPWKVF